MIAALLMAMQVAPPQANDSYPIPKAATNARYLSGGPQSVDYPRAALARGAEGTSLVRIRINAEGVADECHVYRTSGDAELDIAACKITLRRGRFQPARDAHDRPVVQYAILPIRWILGD